MPRAYYAINTVLGNWNVLKPLGVRVKDKHKLKYRRVGSDKYYGEK